MKLVKRAGALCMAAAMAMSLSVTAFAAGNGGNKTLTVTNEISETCWRPVHGGGNGHEPECDRFCGWQWW